MRQPRQQHQPPLPQPHRPRRHFEVGQCQPGRHQCHLLRHLPKSPRLACALCVHGLVRRRVWSCVAPLVHGEFARCQACARGAECFGSRAPGEFLRVGPSTPALQCASEQPGSAPDQRRPELRVLVRGRAPTPDSGRPVWCAHHMLGCMHIVYRHAKAPHLLGSQFLHHSLCRG